jgi:hypothetical protein
VKKMMKRARRRDASQFPNTPPDALVGAITTSDDTLIGAMKFKLAARYIAVSPLTLRRLMERGLIRPIRTTRHLTFAVSELNRYMREGQAE